MEDCQVRLSYSPYFQSSSSSPNTLSRLMDEEVWSLLEQRTQEILWIVQPNVESELRRKMFTTYVQRLLVGHFATELALQVFSFGSVPLKAYLPDGDIDLTALCRPNLVEMIAHKVCAILKDHQPQDSTFQIKDVRYVRAQVKVVKCIVNNMPIDISFNQTAGLSTLCFLEQVDQLIGKDHLFKKSIILIKAWCYYESRILGSHSGLIATYGLETLVLFIINRFHSSLRGPLEVLHRFLEYYSTFDWDNYGISINGPVALSSLPAIIVTPQNEGEEYLLSEEFVRECRLAFPDPAVVNAARVDEFQIKFLNIVDPLKDNNNLGRSVSKGNFYRIRSAFSLGAQKLREVFMLPGERIGMALEKFFATTLDRNGSGQRADLPTPVPAFGTGTSEKSDLTGDYEDYCDSLLYANAYQFFNTHNGAPPFVVNDMNKWNALVYTAQLYGNVIFQMAENTHQSFSHWHPSASQSSAATFGVGVIKKSHGTGTYIPNLALQDQDNSRNEPPRARGRIPQSSSRGVRMKSPRKTNQIEVSTEAGPSENACRFNISPEEFPQLPGTQIPSSSEVHQSARPELASPPAKESSRTSGKFKLENTGHSLSLREMPSPVASQQANTSASYAQNFIPGVPTMGMQKQQEPSEVNEATICLRKFTLDNDNDFPPLT